MRAPRRSGGDQHGRQLRDREDEDEVEEELDGRDAELTVVHQLAGLIACAHGAMLAPKSDI